MSRPAAAALFALLTAVTAPARAAEAQMETRDSGTVLTAEAADDPWSGTGSAGSLVIVDKAGHTESYSVVGTTKLTRDGKKVAFDTTLVGDLVVKATFDPQTKLLTILDLKSASAPIPWTKPAPKAAKTAKAKKPAATTDVKGEVAFADAIKGELSVRSGKGRTRKFAVGDTTTVLRVGADGSAQEVGFETVAVGDAVEVRSRDGKTADQIRVSPAAR